MFVPWWSTVRYLFLPVNYQKHLNCLLILFEGTSQNISNKPLSLLFLSSVVSIYTWPTLIFAFIPVSTLQHSTNLSFFHLFSHGNKRWRPWKERWRSQDGEKKEKGPKISQESKGKEKKGRCQTLEISCVPSLVISTTSKLDHTETKADPKLLLNSFYMYLT